MEMAGGKVCFNLSARIAAEQTVDQGINRGGQKGIFPSNYVRTVILIRYTFGI
jgi:hypothetical protein